MLPCQNLLWYPLINPTTCRLTGKSTFHIRDPYPKTHMIFSATTVCHAPDVYNNQLCGLFNEGPEFAYAKERNHIPWITGAWGHDRPSPFHPSTLKYRPWVLTYFSLKYPLKTCLIIGYFIKKNKETKSKDSGSIVDSWGREWKGCGSVLRHLWLESVRVTLKSLVL